MVLLGAIGVIVRNHPVHAALSLVLTLFGIAVLFVAQEAHFLAAVQVIVYAGAIVVLFLFVIMLLGAESLVPLPQAMPWQRPLAFILAAILAVESVYLIFARSRLNTVITAPDAATNSMEGLRDMAMILFDQFLLPFEITSILLLVAMVGAIVLTNREKVGHK